MLDVSTIQNPAVQAFEQKMPGMFFALVKHETIALQEVIARYARGRMGDVPLDVGSEIDLAAATAIAVPVLANAVITSGAEDLGIRAALHVHDRATLEKQAAFLVESMVDVLRGCVPLIVAKVIAADGQARRDFPEDGGASDA